MNARLILRARFIVISVLLAALSVGCPTPSADDKGVDPHETGDPIESGDTGSSETAEMDTAVEETGDRETGETGAAPEPCDTGALVGIAVAKFVGEEEDDSAASSLAAADDVDGDGWGDLLVGAGHAGVGGRAYLLRGPFEGRRCLAGADARFIGETANDGLGAALAGVGDIDLDGMADLLIGVPGGRKDAAWLVLGPVSGDVHEAEVDALLVDDASSNWGGLAGPGDLNGDGWRDLVIGAPGATGLDVESTRGHCADDDVDEGGVEHGADAGLTYVVLGPVSGEVSLEDAEGRLVGEDGGDILGIPVAGSGDVNGDGLDDVLVSAKGNCEGGYNAGASYLVHGPASGDLYIGDADLKLVGDGARATGFAIAGGHDGDGDGLPDILVGSPYYGTGLTYVIYGPGTGTLDLSSVSATISGSATSDYAGLSLSWAGDVDGDGFEDVLLGAAEVDIEWERIGTSYVVLGPVTGAHVLSDTDIQLTGVRGDDLGYSLTSAGDVNHDGSPDLLLGAVGDAEGGYRAGAAWLVLGGPDLIGGTL